MSLRVIGSGFGWTGTMSTKLALEQLGFGTCHHMVEVMNNPDQPAHWKAISDGATVDWPTVFAGYNSQVDWPGAAVWPATATAFPKAKVIHTERPEEDWWNSFSKTIGKFFGLHRSLALPPHIAAIMDTMDRWLIRGTFGPEITRDIAIAAYRCNNARVRAEFPADRLLVFRVSDAWEPLCRFLGVAAPDTAFPHSNARDEFWAHFGGEPS